MNRQTLAALIVLNVVLLAALVVVGFSPRPAQAQGFSQQQYIMVAGETVGRTQQAVVYVIELSTARMAALFFNTSNNQLEVIAGREMRGDMGGTTRDR